MFIIHIVYVKINRLPLSSVTYVWLYAVYDVTGVLSLTI